jgi:hypothetical protein
MLTRILDRLLERRLFKLGQRTGSLKLIDQSSDQYADPYGDIPDVSSLTHAQPDSQNGSRSNG